MYHPPAHRFHGIFRAPTTKLGKKALWSLALSLAFFVAMIIGEGIGEALSNNPDPNAPTPLVLELAWLVGLFGVVGCFVMATITAAAAVMSRAERSPAVVAVALVTSFLVLEGAVRILQSLIG